MNMPGMAGEASVYKTNSFYRSTTGRAFLGNSNTTVTPQDCGITEAITCAAYVLVAGTVCAGFCLAGPAACLGCILTLGPLGTYIACHDCLPGSITNQVDIALHGGGGGGGGGPRPCCPPGRRCCGSCVPLSGGGGFRCDDVCIGPGQQCP